MTIQLPSRTLVSQQDASLIERADIPRSTFKGIWTRKTAFDAGYLVPILVDEILPGDHMRYEITAYVRMATPVFPLMDNQRIDTFFFFVPSRLLWEHWQAFMGEQATPSAIITDYTLPVATIPAGLGNPLAGDPAVGSIFDHMGLPNVNVPIEVNALPFRAYNLIFNEWFRDQNLQDPAPFGTGDDEAGPSTQYYELRRRNKPHDYFTSALPWPQKFETPTMPMGGLAPVIGIGFQVGSSITTGTLNNLIEANRDVTSYTDYKATGAAGTFFDMSGSDPATAYPRIFADLNEATGVSINQLRQAFMTQALLERDARGGTRYVELIKAHFNVTNPDFRLMRPEYIGGGQTPLTVTPIAQTAPGSGSTVGTLGAAGAAAGNHSASFAATEHGYIIGLINVRSDISYHQGLHKMWSRRTRYDFYWPALSQLGEQAILSKELYMDGTSGDDSVFGYQERWHEYRTRTNEVVGIMRSDVPGTLDAWHLGQSFADRPTLSSAFIEDDPPMTRVLAGAELAANQQYIADIMYRRTATRPIPTFGTPALMGRF